MLSIAEFIKKLNAIFNSNGYTISEHDKIEYLMDIECSADIDQEFNKFMTFLTERILGKY